MQMFSRIYLGYSIIKDRFITKLLNLNLFYDEGALSSNSSTSMITLALFIGRDFVHIVGCFFGMKFIYTRKWALIQPFVNWQTIYFFKSVNFNTFLSSSFRQNQMHLFWAACKYFFSFQVFVKIRVPSVIPFMWFMWLLWSDVFCICGIIGYNIVNKCIK